MCSSSLQLSVHRQRWANDPILFYECVTRCPRFFGNWACGSYLFCSGVPLCHIPCKSIDVVRLVTLHLGESLLEACIFYFVLKKEITNLWPWSHRFKVVSVDSSLKDTGTRFSTQFSLHFVQMFLWIVKLCLKVPYYADFQIRTGHCISTHTLSECSVLAPLLFQHICWEIDFPVWSKNLTWLAESLDLGLTVSLTSSPDIDGGSLECMSVVSMVQSLLQHFKDHTVFLDQKTLGLFFSSRLNIRTQTGSALAWVKSLHPFYSSLEIWLPAKKQVHIPLMLASLHLLPDDP